MATTVGIGQLAQSDRVFVADPVAYVQPGETHGPTRPGVMPLRTIAVEERTGVARQRTLVRVPLFFEPGECAQPDDVAVMTEGGEGVPLLTQCDDVRRGPDGGVSRMHLWIEIDVEPLQRKTFWLVKCSAERTPKAPMRVSQNDGGLDVATASGVVRFNARGGLHSIQTDGHTWDFGPQGAAPQVRVTYTDHRPGVSLGGKAGAAPEVRWAAGVLFSKVTLRWTAADGARLEQEWRIPRRGGEVVLTSAVFLGARPGGKIAENRLLVADVAPEGKLIEVPAGVRPDLRSAHAYAVNAWANGDSALLAEPVVIGGSNGRWERAPGGALALAGFRGVERGKSEQETLRAFWTEVRLVPAKSTDGETLWETHRRVVQPLVGVVDDPRIDGADLHEALQEIARGMKPVNWAQEAARFQVLGAIEKRDGVWRKHPNATETSTENLVRSAENAWAKLSENGKRKLREDEKSRASGLLDPYHVTYTLSSAAALAATDDAPEKIDAALQATADASRQFLGRTDEEGFPYIDCFSRTLNMQTGPVLFGLAAKGDDAAARARRNFYRDLATAPVVLGIFGRGERPYVATRREKPDYSDYLYQAISDFWLRTAELLGHEDLQLHPLAFSRYTDCVDVLADRYHALDSRDRDGSAGPARANFFRGQGHTHRWLGWSCAPFIRLLETPSNDPRVGLTEAVYYARARAPRWNNWPDLTFYALADLLTNTLKPDAQKPPLPALPRGVSARVTAGGVELTWGASASAVSYRVLRAPSEVDQWTWLNSPYRTGAVIETLNSTRFSDPEGRAGSRYVVLAVDREGRASAWPLDATCAVTAKP